MYIAYKSVNIHDSEIREEIAIFKGLDYCEKWESASISLKGFVNIYLPMDNPSYKKLATSIKTGIARGSELFDIKSGICLCTNDPDKEFTKLQDKARRLCDRTIHSPFSYQF